MQGEGEIFFGGVVLHFHNGKCYLIADGEMFPIRMRNLTTFPFGKHIVGKLDSWAFVVVFDFNINVGVYEKLAKK